MPGVSRQGVFLSYRREDAGPYARSLQLQLSQRIEDARIFMDLDSIEPGLDFAEVIEEAVRSSAVLVALIGRQWLTLTDEEGTRRLDNPDDYVRFEVKTALERGVRVIPVLIDGATPLRRQDLPEELHKLARLNAHKLSYDRYRDDADRLLDLIQRVLAAVGEEARSESERADSSPIPALVAQPSGLLISPRDGGEVNHQEKVTGMITGLGPEEHPLIIVQSQRTGFWPQAELWPDPAGRFESQASFGRNDETDSGKEYILMLVAAKPPGSASLQASRGHPMSKLPPDARVLDQATVKRRRPGSSGSGQNSLPAIDNGIASDPHDVLARNLPATKCSRPVLLQSDWGEQGNFELLVPHGNVIRQYMRDNDDSTRPWHYLRDFGYPVGAGQPGPTPRSVTFIQSNFRNDGQHGAFEAIVRVAPPAATEPDRLDFWWLDSKTLSWNGPFPLSADGTPIDGITGD